jgi:hypothetical protein
MSRARAAKAALGRRSCAKSSIKPRGHHRAGSAGLAACGLQELSVAIRDELLGIQCRVVAEQRIRELELGYLLLTIEEAAERLA